jgi:hypothetical protein
MPAPPPPRPPAGRPFLHYFPRAVLYLGVVIVALTVSGLLPKTGQSIRHDAAASLASLVSHHHAAAPPPPAFAAPPAGAALAALPRGEQAAFRVAPIATHRHGVVAACDTNSSTCGCGIVCLLIIERGVFAPVEASGRGAGRRARFA